jgi:hypothetical protein
VKGIVDAHPHAAHRGAMRDRGAFRAHSGSLVTGRAPIRRTGVAAGEATC